MKKEKSNNNPQLDLLEKRNQLWQKGYASIPLLEEAALNDFKKDPQHIKKLITVYYFGTQFSHVDAYKLCSLGRIWPDFCFHPSEKEYVLTFMKINNTTGVRNYAIKFEKWIDENRKQVCKDVAQNLSID